MSGGFCGTVICVQNHSAALGRCGLALSRRLLVPMIAHVAFERCVLKDTAWTKTISGPGFSAWL